MTNNLEEVQMAHKEDDTRMLKIWQEASGRGEDGFKMLLESILQRVLKEELTAFIGADRHERIASRNGYRNGYKPRMLNTRLGTMELMVPKDRDGRFQTELFDRYQRSEKALMLGVVQMYLQGVSTRKVKKITEDLCGLDISKSQVSNLTKGLDEDLNSWRTRDLSGQRYPYLMIDARYEKVRINRQVLSQGIFLVVGVREDGYREILGTWVCESKNEASWSDAFKDLKSRGLNGVKYVVSDDHEGLRKAIDRYFQGCMWQRCQVHFVRNALKQVARKDREAVAKKLRQITEAPDIKDARKRIEEIAVEIEDRYPKVSELLDEFGEEILNVYSLPEQHQRKMRSTNMLERYNQELKRRTRVIRIFPDRESCLRLVTALAMETSEDWMVRRYLTFEGEVSGMDKVGRKAA